MSKNKRASEDSLGDLHSKLAEVLTDAIKNGVTILDKEGVAHTVAAPAAILNVARQFLKDNGIDTVPTVNSPLGDLAKSLPSFDEEGNVENKALN